MISNFSDLFFYFIKQIKKLAYESTPFLNHNIFFYFLKSISLRTFFNLICNKASFYLFYSKTFILWRTPKNISKPEDNLSPPNETNSPFLPNSRFLIIIKNPLPAVAKIRAMVRLHPNKNLNNPLKLKR